ncbi:hypothetical protein F4703DRAFT_1795680 [Phycomyces blakesleeanus]
MKNLDNSILYQSERMVLYFLIENVILNLFKASNSLKKIDDALREMRGDSDVDSGSKSLIKNRFVFAITIFVSLGGVLFWLLQKLSSQCNLLKMTLLCLFSTFDARWSQVLYCLLLAIFFDGRSLQGAAQNLSYLTTSRFITDMAITETLALGLFLLPRRLGEESIQSQSSSEHAILYAQQQSPVQFTGLNYPTARKNTTKEKITSHPYITSQYMTSYHDISHMCFGETGEEKVYGVFQRGRALQKRSGQ